MNNFLNTIFQWNDYFILPPGSVIKHRDMNCPDGSASAFITSPLYSSILVLLLDWSTPTFDHTH